MIQLSLIDVRLALNSGDRAYIFTSNQRCEAVLLIEEESIDEKKKRMPGHLDLLSHRHFYYNYKILSC